MILAIDPGTGKCGLALLESDGSLVSQQVVSRDELVTVILETTGKQRLDRIILGAGTASEKIKSELGQSFDKRMIACVEEDGTTLLAKRLWLETRGSRGLLAYVPRCIMQFFIPDELDGYAACVLGRRWLEGAGRTRHDR